MADEEQAPAISLPDGDTAQALERPRRQLWRVVVFGLTGLLLLAVAMAWLNRKQIADNVISTQLDQLGLPATYQVESISTDMQVLRNLVIGDPKHPDLTIERVEVAIVPRFGMPELGRVTLVKPRLYGSYRNGKLSFGSLDPLIFTGGKEPFRLPDYDIAIRDGRGLLESDFGRVGLKLEGAGALRDGFSGIIAAVVPQGELPGCAVEGASIYGKLTVTGEKPRFAGPLRLASLDCGKQGGKLVQAALQIEAVADQALDGVEGKLDLATGALTLDGNRARSAEGKASFTFRKQALTAHYAINGKSIETPQAMLAGLGVEGVVRAQNMFARVEVEGDAHGSGIRLGKGVDSALATAQAGAQGTLAAPLLTQIRSALQREGRASALTGNFILRQADGVANLIVPQAVLRGGSGQALLALSRVQLNAGSSGGARLAGNFSTGGAGLPRIAGRMEQGARGALTMRMTMAEYRAGTARLAVPQLMLVQSANGALGFAGRAMASGDLPGGKASNLVLPVEGNWSAARGLAVWRKCVPIGFDSLTLANLTLQKRGVTLCPPPGRAILASDARGTRLAAGASSLDLAGHLGATPIRITGGALGFAWPGSLAARDINVALGPPEDASKFSIANLNARIGRELAGHFTGGDVGLSAVPLDVLGTEGDWHFAGGRLTIANAAFTLKDRQRDARFQPLVSTGAQLQLENNVITAQAMMREPGSGRDIVGANIRHELSSGRGHADLSLAGIEFDRKLQPDTLTRLALGVVANVEGKVRGEGRIDWNPETTTSTGSFTTDSLDLAAAFGPVKGLTGTVTFTDLLGLVTAPDQRLKLASINPGIEVNDGEVSFALRPDSVLAINGVHWPFLDGTLTLEPTRMVLGASEVRRYTLRIVGLDAAKFIQRMDMGNISATGIFDGVLPLIFDENGGRIEGGQLISRAPGGNVSYVGALTYKDLSTMANFAFDALKSLNYSRMQIDLSGPLEGEIVTRVAFDGIGQGATAKRNFLTKQIARLPIRFNVNLRAPFFKLVGSLRSLYDPTSVRDPRELGLIGSDGKPLQPLPPAANPPAPTVQTPDSGKAP